MNISGISKTGVDLLELEQLMIQGSPEELIKLSKFLAHVAESIRENSDRFGHAHAKDFCDDWGEEKTDIVIFKPF